jgi:D-alanyl-D-alanine carboxypeptidase
LILILFLCTIACSCDQSDPDNPTNKLQTIVDEFMIDQKEILGIMVQLDTPDQGSLRVAGGYSNLLRDTHIQPDDKFLIGSITKMFTATLVHQLIEEGAIGLDDRIVDHLPTDWVTILEGVKYGSEITVAHALSHRSGIYDTPSSSKFFSEMIKGPSREVDPRFMLEMARYTYEPNFEPGTSFGYSSLNYILLGKLIENVTQKPYETVLREKIIDKIGLTNTFFSQGNFGSGLDGIAHGYIKVGERLFDGQEFNSGWAWTAGAIISNNEDLVRFMKELASGRLFHSSDTFQKMRSLYESNKEYGLGLVVLGHEANEEYYGHIGFFGGTSSITCHFPEINSTISVCINFDGTRSLLKAIDLMDTIMRDMP